MKSFFKYFFSALLALVVFFGLIFIITVGIFGSLLNKSAVTIPAGSVLVVDLTNPFQEKKIENPIIELTGNTENELPDQNDYCCKIRFID